MLLFYRFPFEFLVLSHRHRRLPLYLRLEEGYVLSHAICRLLQFCDAFVQLDSLLAPFQLEFSFGFGILLGSDFAKLL